MKLAQVTRALVLGRFIGHLRPNIGRAWVMRVRQGATSKTCTSALSGSTLIIPPFGTAPRGGLSRKYVFVVTRSAYPSWGNWSTGRSRLGGLAQRPFAKGPLYIHPRTRSFGRSKTSVCKACLRSTKAFTAGVGGGSVGGAERAISWASSLVTCS